MIEKYRIEVSDWGGFEVERDAAFSAFRVEAERWNDLGVLCKVALGGDSDNGGWSVVYEDGFWLVFIGERGERYRISIFTNVWDALSYAGNCATSTRSDMGRFSMLLPRLSLG